MRRALTAALAACVLVSVPLWSTVSARAQSGKNAVIAIIDMQKILRESVAVQTMQKELDQRRSLFQSELKTREEELRAADQELARQRAVLSADAYAKKRQNLERQVAGMRREIQERRKALDEDFGQGMNQVRLTLVGIVKKIAEERGADLVLAKATVVLVRPDLEITQEAFERLNAELPRIALPAPQN